MIRIDEKASAKALNLLRNHTKIFNKVISVSLARAGLELQDEGMNLSPFKSGTLRRSITVAPSLIAIKDRVTVGTDVVYARIQDKGGVIIPKKKKFLRFQINGKWIFTKKVKIPKYKGRGYLTPAYNTQKKGRARKIFEEEILKAIT